jgi:hypothetical protein
MRLAAMVTRMPGGARGRSIVVLSLLAGLLGGCTPFTACTDDLRQRLDPTSATLDVGETVQARAEFLGCGGSKRLTDEITWSSADPAIASVEATTGRITGRSPGTTTVTPSGARYGAIGHVPVTVR